MNERKIGKSRRTLTFTGTAWSVQTVVLILGHSYVLFLILRLDVCQKVVMNVIREHPQYGQERISNPPPSSQA